MGDWDDVLFFRTWAMPSKDTFSIKPIGNFVMKYLGGISVDPFARNNGWATYTNDLNPNTTAQHHMDAAEFLNMLADKGVVADAIILDPPYSPRQISECYSESGLKCTMTDTQSAVLYKRVREAAKRLCRKGTIILSFGWNSTGMGKGYKVIECLLVCHGGAHNDTICLAEVVP